MNKIRISIVFSLLFSATFSWVEARPTYKQGSVAISYSFNTYDMSALNKEIFFLNVWNLFGRPVEALPPIRWGNGYGFSLRYGLFRRIYLEGGLERLESLSTGGDLSPTRSTLVDLDVGLWAGRMGIKYNLPVIWGIHFNFGVQALFGDLKGQLRVRDSIDGESAVKITARGTGVEFIIAEPEFFLSSQSLRITFGYRYFVLPEIRSDVDNGKTLTTSPGPGLSSTEALRFDYSGAFARASVLILFGKGR